MSRAFDYIDEIAESCNAAVFDMDGTLLDSMYVWRNVASDYLHSFGITPEENLNEILFPKSMIQVADYLNVHYRLNKTAESVLDEIVASVAAEYRNVVKAKVGVAGFLKGLRQRNVKCAVATAGDRRVAMSALKRNGLLDFFQAVFTCGELGTSKDEPVIFSHASSFLESLPCRTVVFEDGLVPAKTATAAGFTVAGIYDEDSRNHADEMKKICKYYFDEW